MRLILVGCVAGKAAGPAEARDLYTSPLFAKRRAFAELLAERLGTRWRILSAKHGLLDPTTVVHPYDEQLVRARVSDFSFKVRRGLEGLVAEGDVLEVHAGVHYVDGVERAVRWLESFGGMQVCMEAPLRGLGIGQQLGWYKARELERRPPPARCVRCGREPFTRLAWCGDCLLELAPTAPGVPLSVYATPNACVALYEGGDTRRFDGRVWVDPEPTWPERRHWMGMLEQKKRHPKTLTDAGRAMLGLPVVEQLRLL